MAIGFGIIGCGMIAKFHARAIADAGAKLVACYNRSPGPAAALAAETGCRAYTDLDALLADPAVQVVTIATPSGAHLEPALAAAAAGKHIIVEKPLEITLDRCDQLIAACRRAGVILSTTFPSRFHAPSREIKQAIDAGRFGRLTLGDAYVKWYRTQQYYDSGAWRGTWKLDGGGALMNQAIHSIDLLLWFMGPAVEVSAHTATLAHERIAVEDVAVASIRFANGALGTIEGSTAVWPGALKRIEIHGVQGTAIMEEEDIKEWRFAAETPADEALRQRLSHKTKTGGGASDPKAIGHHGHTAQFLDVMGAIQEQRPPLIDGAEGRRAVELILAIYQAAEIGRSVALPLAGDPVLAARSRDVTK